MAKSLRTLLLVLAGVLPGAQDAFADDLAHVFAELSHLGFRLSDLNPDDGITPAWTLNVGRTMTQAEVATDEPGMFTPVVNTGGTSLAVVTSDSLRVDVTLTDNETIAGALARVTSFSQGDTFGLTITPHTRLTIDAIVTADVWRRDPACVSTGSGSSKSCVYAQTFMELHAMDNNHVFANDGAFGAGFAPWGPDGTSQSYQVPYTFIYENTTDLPTRVGFSAEVWALAQVRTIPEPSTTLLGLAGLAFVAAMARRRPQA
jgi:hypothetical protein